MVNSCATTVAMNNSYIVNPGYPGELDVTETCESSQATNARSAVPAKAARLFFPAEATTTTTTEATVAADVTAANPKSYVYTITKASATVRPSVLQLISYSLTS